MKSKRREDLFYYQELLDTCVMLPEWKDSLADSVSRISLNKHRYQEVVKTKVIPWIFVALIHEQEADCRFEKQIYNGGLWKKATSFKGKTVGPWNSWEESVLDCIRRNAWHREKDWSTPALLKRLEAHNGWGYYRRGVNSPYLWSASQYGENCGLYVQDGQYDDKARSKQVGAGMLLHVIMEQKIWVPAEEVAA